MTKAALIIGCSHAAGSEMYLEPDIDLGAYNAQTYGIYHSYPSLLSQMLGYHPMNHAIPGGSNDAMFRIWESFVNPYSKKPKPDLVIACWTGNDRTEIWDFENEAWQGLAPGKKQFHKIKKDGSVPEGDYLPEVVENQEELLNYQKHWVTYHADAWSGRLNKIKNVLALNTMAKVLDIPVINIDSFEPIREFKWPEDIYFPMDDEEEFTTWAVNAGYKHTRQGHFFFEAHKRYAKKLLSRLDDKFKA